ncbi:MAG: mdtK [Gammaproteobacteria bacterium]|jgi:Na+-driven multidrug efflux pump|nr:mdtK [Gammaproteobacteria bacterium]
MQRPAALTQVPQRVDGFELIPPTPTAKHDHPQPQTPPSCLNKVAQAIGASPVKEIAPMGMAIMGSFDFSAMLIAVGLSISLLTQNQDEIAAAALATTMTNFLVGLSTAYLFSIAIWVGRRRGELIKIEEEKGSASEETKQLRQLISGVFFKGLTASAPLVPIAMFPLIFSRSILEGVGQNPEVASLAAQFLQVYAAAIPALWLRMCAEQIIIAFGQQKAAMLIATGSFVVSTGLAYYLYTQLDLAGIALAYTIGAYLTTIGVLAYLGLHDSFKQFNFLSTFQLSVEAIKYMWWTLLKEGGPIAAAFSFEFLLMFMLTAIAGLKSKDALAAQNFAAQVAFMVFIPNFAFASAASNLLNTAVGEGDYNRASSYAKWGMVTSLIAVCLIGIPLAAVSRQFIQAINPNSSEALLEAASSLVRLQIGAGMLDSPRIAIWQNLRMLGYNWQSTLVSMFCMSTSLPLAYGLSQHTELGVDAIPISYAVALVINTLALAIPWANRTRPEAMQALKEGGPLPSYQICCPMSSGRVFPVRSESSSPTRYGRPRGDTTTAIQISA